MRFPLCIYLIFCFGFIFTSCKDNLSDITVALTSQVWDKPKRIQIYGIYSYSWVNCPERHEFTKNGKFYFSTEACEDNFEGTWEWIVEDEKLFIDFENRQDKYIKIIEVNEEILHTIEYSSEDKEFTSFIEYEYEAR